jgi:hypothetical protein
VPVTDALPQVADTPQQEADTPQLAADTPRLEAATPQQAAATPPRQQEAAAPQHLSVPKTDGLPRPKETPPNGSPGTAEVIVHPKTTVAAVPANRGTGAGPWLLLGVGALSVLLMAIPLVSLLVYRRHGRQEEGPRLGRLVAVTPGRGPRRKSALAASSPAALKLRCVACDKKVKVIGGKVGKRFRCPRCGAVQTIRA